VNGTIQQLEQSITSTMLSDFFFGSKGSGNANGKDSGMYVGPKGMRDTARNFLVWWDTPVNIKMAHAAAVPMAYSNHTGADFAMLTLDGWPPEPAGQHLNFPF
jgi:hypothetical protein